jgi:hypothetical protein
MISSALDESGQVVTSSTSSTATPSLVPDFLQAFYRTLPAHYGPTADVDELLTALVNGVLPLKQETTSDMHMHSNGMQQVAEHDIAIETGDVQSAHPHMLKMGGAEYSNTGNSYNSSNKRQRMHQQNNGNDSDDEETNNSGVAHTRPVHDVFRQRQLAKIGSSA